MAYLATIQHYSPTHSVEVSLSATDFSPQVICDVANGRLERLVLPPASACLMDRVRWGYAECLFTPAFWAAQAWYYRRSARYSNFAWGPTLSHEVVACLLGGHGISSELNKAAFEHLCGEGLFENPNVPVTQQTLFRLLKMPLIVNGRAMRYRFPVRKSFFLAAALEKLRLEPQPADNAFELRKWLLAFPGVGLKTASWITRNHLRSSEVAIIDIHIYRAGVIMGLFSGRERLPRDYLLMEKKFLTFAKAIGVTGEQLDVLIWRTMKDSRRLGIEAYDAAA